jgi:hypothetical protein
LDAYEALAESYAARVDTKPHNAYCERPATLSLLPAIGGKRVLDAEIYVNISSPVEIKDSEIRFTDYELDVSRNPPHAARIVDEDEFLEAVSRYGYSEDFQQACYQVAREAIQVATGWVAEGMPTAQA